MILLFCRCFYSPSPDIRVSSLSFSCCNFNAICWRFCDWYNIVTFYHLSDNILTQVLTAPTVSLSCGFFLIFSSSMLSVVHYSGESWWRWLLITQGGRTWANGKVFNIGKQLFFVLYLFYDFFGFIYKFIINLIFFVNLLLFFCNCFNCFGIFFICYCFGSYAIQHNK